MSPTTALHQPGKSSSTLCASRRTVAAFKEPHDARLKDEYALARPSCAAKQIMG